jgi:hypothetical protein
MLSHIVLSTPMTSRRRMPMVLFPSNTTTRSAARHQLEQSGSNNAERPVIRFISPFDQG